METKALKTVVTAYKGLNLKETTYAVNIFLPNGDIEQLCPRKNRRSAELDKDVIDALINFFNSPNRKNPDAPYAPVSKHTKIVNYSGKYVVEIETPNAGTYQLCPTIDYEIAKINKESLDMLFQDELMNSKSPNEYIGDKDYKFNPNDILKSPANYLLQDCLKQLKFGRPASDQKLIDKFIDITKLCYNDETLEQKDKDSMEHLVINFGKNGEGLTNEIVKIGKKIEALSKNYRVYLRDAFIDELDDVYQFTFVYFPLKKEEVKQETKDPAANPSCFSSRFGIDEHVKFAFVFGENNENDGVIEAVKFTREGKVLYDVATPIRDSKTKDLNYTIFKEVDSALLTYSHD